MLTATEHLPSAPVTHSLGETAADEDGDAPVDDSAEKVTVAPGTGAPSLVTVAVRVALPPASTAAGPDSATVGPAGVAEAVPSDVVGDVDSSGELAVLGAEPPDVVVVLLDGEEESEVADVVGAGELVAVGV